MQIQVHSIGSLIHALIKAGRYENNPCADGGYWGVGTNLKTQPGGGCIAA